MTMIAPGTYRLTRAVTNPSPDRRTRRIPTDHVEWPAGTILTVVDEPMASLEGAVTRYLEFADEQYKSLYRLRVGWVRPDGTEEVDLSADRDKRPAALLAACEPIERPTRLAVRDIVGDHASWVRRIVTRLVETKRLSLDDLRAAEADLSAEVEREDAA
jgi:hypothetical protein